MAAAEPSATSAGESAPVQADEPVPAAEPGPGPTGEPRLRRVGAAAAVVAALAVGHLVTTAVPVSEHLNDPFVRQGELGRPVELRYGTVTAGAPTGSTAASNGQQVLVTDGVFVSVPITFVAARAPEILAGATVIGGDGRSYQTRPGSRSPFTIGQAQPGVPRYATLVVEMPVDAVPGSRLRLFLDRDDPRRDDMAEIDLHVTIADAQAWAADDTVLKAPRGSDLEPDS